VPVLRQPVVAVAPAQLQPVAYWPASEPTIGQRRSSSSSVAVVAFAGPYLDAVVAA
jgi:hypothetical protein